MWLSVGDLGTGVNVGSPVINLNTGDSQVPAPAASTGFDWSTIYKSPFFYAVIIIALFVISRKK